MGRPTSNSLDLLSFRRRRGSRGDAVRSDGSADGTGSSDDDDASITYDIEITEVSNLKTYSWYYQGYHTLEVTISSEAYMTSKRSKVDRNPTYLEESLAFVTVNNSVIQEVAAELESMADARGYDIVETADFVLAFVQGLEYTEDDVTAGADEYFRFPVETLYDEQGDCEDTTFLYASLMEAMGYDAVLLFIDLGSVGHAMVGLDCPGATGWYVTFESTRYFYCETTGDGYRVGDVDDEVYEGETIALQAP